MAGAGCDGHARRADGRRSLAQHRPAQPPGSGAARRDRDQAHRAPRLRCRRRRAAARQGQLDDTAGRIPRRSHQSRLALRPVLRLRLSNAQVAEEALRSGKINLQEYWYIEEYRRRHGRAPHTTSLGGLIGIHGLGRGDPDVHRNFDWTEGCVAVSNEEIRALDPWLRIGTRVVITG
ncbi:murein L,D-transpeptidase [Billgrantia tianxiuensis]|uniref:Murein L,D-transpeptidase n=1 Tax=Billgrantia tianxiuensis TaxID=2497861 RepID=A0A6I6SV34_9GAMM|nr:murein L,D-transpeptidase [Halomonas tianxiuensis]